MSEHSVGRDVYSGDFDAEGNRHGRGTLLLANGDKYKGKSAAIKLYIP